MKGIVLIDICGTLYDSNTTFDFIRWSFPGKRKMKRWLSGTLFAKGINKLFLLVLGLDVLRVWWVRELKGFQKSELDHMSASFYAESLIPRRIDEVHEQVERYRRLGYRLVLVSATLDFIAATIAEELAIVEVHSTLLDYKGDVCLGSIRRDLLGKKDGIAGPLLKGYDEVILITDNKSDDVLLEMSSGGYIVSGPKNLPFWKSKQLGDNFKFILTSR